MRAKIDVLATGAGQIIIRQTPSIPEPSSFVLLATRAMVMLGYRSRRWIFPIAGLVLLATSETVCASTIKAQGGGVSNTERALGLF
jgi:hypothetical protein